MKCARCGDETFVLKTNPESQYHVIRTYRCAAGHDTCTHEVLAPGISKKDLAAAERNAQRAAAIYARNQAILRDLSSMPATHLSKKWNLTDARIRQIRDTVPVEQPKEHLSEHSKTRVHRLS